MNNATQISVIDSNGDWAFIFPDMLPFERSPDGRTFLILNEIMGTVLENQTDPSIIYQQGSQGDILVWGVEGTYTITPKEKWNIT